MDQQYFMNFSGSDFFLLGVIIGSFFHTFTTISLMLIFLVLTNRKVGGIETWTYLTGLYRFSSNFLSSSFNTQQKPVEKEKEKRKTKKKNPVIDPTPSIMSTVISTISAEHSPKGVVD